MRFPWIALWGFSSSTLCAFTPQAVVITPRLEVESSRIGADQSLGLSVVDERPRQTLGTRGVRGIGAELTIAGNLQEIVQEAISEGLSRRGFRSLYGQSTEGRDLRVEIRNLDYTVIEGFWAGTLR